MKLRGKVRRRADGSFEARVEDQFGNAVWRCDHPHRYGTSNRVKQDAASKCAHARVKEMRGQHGRGEENSQEASSQTAEI